jgi:hypothetical protein
MFLLLSMRHVMVRLGGIFSVLWGPGADGELHGV